MKEILKFEKGYNILFLDFSKAFDSLTRKWFILALLEHHVPLKIAGIIFILYQTVTINIKLTKNQTVHRSQNIHIHNGVLQGDILSPSIFILGLDSIIRRIPKDEDRKLLIEVFAYADDLAIISRNLHEALKKIKSMDDLTPLTGLKLSIEKTKIMPLTKEHHTPYVSYKEVFNQDFPYTCSKCDKGILLKDPPQQTHGQMQRTTCYILQRISSV